MRVYRKGQSKCVAMIDEALIYLEAIRTELVTMKEFYNQQLEFDEVQSEDVPGLKARLNRARIALNQVLIRKVIKTLLP